LWKSIWEDENQGNLNKVFAKDRTPNLLAKQAGTPVLGFSYFTTKASCQVPPRGHEKKPNTLGIFLLIYYFLLLHI
jgi:hypothetical protein